MHHLSVAIEDADHFGYLFDDDSDDVLSDVPAVSARNLLDQLRRVCRLESCSACDVYRACRLERTDIQSCAHLDGGANASTTDNLNALWYCHRIQRRVALREADDAAYHLTHAGYLKVPTMLLHQGNPRDDHFSFSHHGSIASDSLSSAPAFDPDPIKTPNEGAPQ